MSKPRARSCESTSAQISEVENATLNPVFGDLLSPAAAAPVSVVVHSTILELSVRSADGHALVIGKVAPGAGHLSGSVTVLARAAGSKHGFHRVATDRLGADDGNFAVYVLLAAGRWQIKVSFKDPKEVVASASRATTVEVVPSAPSRVSWRALRVERGAVTATAALTPGAPAGSKVELVGLDTAAAAPARFRVLATGKPGTGNTKITLHDKLTVRSRWVLQLEYLVAGQASSISAPNTTAVR